MTGAVEEILERLSDAGVRLDRGLTEADLRRIEKKFGFTFASDHRALLRVALPVGDSWLNWRHATEVKIRERLRQPVDTTARWLVVSGVWPLAFGPKPEDPGELETAVRAFLGLAPVLVPLLADRYLPSGTEAGVASTHPTGPVLEITAAGVSGYAGNLLEFVDREFGTGPAPSGPPPVESLPELELWSDLFLASGR